MSDHEPSISEITPRWNFSLLYPIKSELKLNEIQSELNSAAQKDLGINSILAGFTHDQEKQKEIRKTLCILVHDPETIQYRQDIFEDLLANPELVEQLEFIFPTLDSLARYTARAYHQANSLQQVIWRLGELQNVIDCIQGLQDIFRSIKRTLKSRGL